MPKTSPAKKFWSHQYYLARKDEQLKAQKAAYQADPQKFCQRMKIFCAEHIAALHAYDAYYSSSLSREKRIKKKARARLNYFDKTKAKVPRVNHGINALIAAARVLDAPSQPTLLQHSDSPLGFPETVSPVRDPPLGAPVVDVPSSQERESRLPSPPSSPTDGLFFPLVGFPESSHLSPLPPDPVNPPTAPESGNAPDPAKPKSVQDETIAWQLEELHRASKRKYRGQLSMSINGTLSPLPPHSQSGTIFGSAEVPRKEGSYSFPPTEFKNWSRGDAGSYQDKIGNTFICRLCRQKAASKTHLESGHAAFCALSKSGGKNIMDLTMADYKRKNNSPPARDAKQPSKRKTPLPATHFWQPQRKVAKETASISPNKLLEPTTCTSPRKLSSRKRSHSMSLRPSPHITSGNQSKPEPSPSARRKNNKSAAVRRITTLKPRPKIVSPGRKPSPMRKSIPKMPNPAPNEDGFFDVVRRPLTCFGKEPPFEFTLEKYSDSADYVPICTRDRKHLRPQYQIYKNGEVLHLERSAQFLRQLRKDRLQHAVSHTKMDNKTFQAKYSKCVYEAMEAAKLGHGLPLGNASQFEPIAAWQSQKTKVGKLTRRAEKFQKEALDNLTMATEVLRRAENKLGFTAHRDNWRQWLRTQFQLLIASIASIRCRDTRLIDVCKVFRFFGFFHINFMSEEKHIGLMQDLAWLVGFNFYSDEPYYWCATAKYIKYCNGGKLPSDKIQVSGLPGSGQKVTALVIQDVFCCPEHIAGDSHVCVMSLAWNYADVPKTSTWNPDIVTHMLEDWFPKERNRELNSTFTGSKQFYYYEGDSERRKSAQVEIENITRELHGWGKIQQLLDAKLSDYRVCTKKS